MSAKNRNAPARGGSTGVGAWVAVAAGVTAVLVAVLLVLNAGTDGSTSLSSGEGESIAHVHGLGIDPADGTLHVATHNGLYQLSEDGTAERVSRDRHDFMGFTVADADHFLASGHPSPGTDAARELERPLFGLIESTDGGVTWTARSLSGDVDFHALEAAHGQVYGFDATNSRFLVSSDGVEWDARSTIPIADIAVDPDDPDRIVASSADGLIESADGGRSWAPVAGAPPVVFVDWHAERGLWGLDGQGQLHHLDGETWQVRHALAGSPQALLVHDTGVVAAVDDGSTVIYRSSDGDDWDALYRDQSAT